MFDSCSAYHPSPHLLFLSHCVPNPPDKGERIRAHHELIHLTKRFQVHLACFARSASEQAKAEELHSVCASVYAERLRPMPALAAATVRFGLGQCLTTSFYGSGRLQNYVQKLSQRVPLAGVFVYSSAMAQYRLSGVPYWMDLVDVDSEKWLQYGRTRKPGFLFRWEGERLRHLESRYAAEAEGNYLSTGSEAALFRRFAHDIPVLDVENGVDFDYFAPQQSTEFQPPRQLVFTGAMDYFPNADAATWFAREALPLLRQRDPRITFAIVGRDPAPAVRRLDRLPGVTVTGAVPDIRPWLASAWAVVAPLRIARGIQNKVLEALAMDKPVLASPSVCQTFGAHLPTGIVSCSSAEEYVSVLLADKSKLTAQLTGKIRDAARRRFSWPANLQALSSDLEAKLLKTPVHQP